VGEIGNLFNLIFTGPILNGLTLLYQLFNDFGLAIVVLTLVIKLLLVPLTIQNLKSMKAQQSMQPKMQELRKKYKNDPQTLNRETMAMYKEAGVNPLSGCLPLLIQLPVLYGLYFAISAFLNAHVPLDINHWLYSFVPHFTAATMPNINFNWFKFLGISFSLGKPDPTHVLPILAGIATYVQLRMSQPKVKPIANATPDPSQQTMKMMQLIMPFFTVFIGWSFPSGMALYWTVSYSFQVVQQYFITGWGSLFEVPDLLKGLFGIQNSNKGKSTSKEVSSPSREKSKTYTGDSTKEQELLDQTDDDTVEAVGPVAGRMRNGSNGNSNDSTRGGSQYNRRQSASARRRSTQRSRG